MFCTSGILIFIFAENNYSIYAHSMLIKHLCSLRALVPLSCFLSLSLFQADPLETQRLSEFTFLPGLREGTLRLHRIKREPEASINRASPVSGTLLAFFINQGISASFSLLYLLIGRLQTTRFQSIKGPQQMRT